MVGLRQTSPRGPQSRLTSGALLQLQTTTRVAVELRAMSAKRLGAFGILFSILCDRLRGRNTGPASRLCPFIAIQLRSWPAIVPAGGLSGRRFRYATDFSGIAARGCLRNTKPEIPAKCVSGVFDGGLKGRLQARLPATLGGRLHAANGQTPDGASRHQRG